MIERIAHAKINLALHVTGQRADGYHLLDSIVVFSDFGDVIRVEKPHHAHGPITVTVGGPFGNQLGSGPENLVTNAALLLHTALKGKGHDLKPVIIQLEKNLPIASGMGGGSADAAATLLALQEYWQSEEDLFPLAEVLGADVAMCLHSKPLRARGVGDEIVLLKAEALQHLVLVNPNIEISTPEVFGQLSEKTNAPIVGGEISELPTSEALREMRNDLQPPAIGLNSAISEVIDAIDKTDPLIARMSGSGATCFGLYETEEQANEAADAILSVKPSWWCVATKTMVA